MKPDDLSADDCRAILRRLGATRRGLARVVGLDPDTLARAERGGRAHSWHGRESLTILPGRE